MNGMNWARIVDEKGHLKVGDGRECDTLAPALLNATWGLISGISLLQQH